MTGWCQVSHSIIHFFYKGEAGESSVFCVFAMIRDEAKGVKRSGDVIHVACFSIVAFGVFGLGVE
jgi:hypothetical protein